MAVHLPYLLYSHQSDYRAYGVFSVTPDAVQPCIFGLGKIIRENGALGLQFQHLDIGQIRTWPFIQALLKHVNNRWRPIRRLCTWWRVDAFTTRPDCKATNQIGYSSCLSNKASNLKLRLLGDLSANVAYVRQQHQWQLSADNIEGVWNGRTNQLGAFLLTHRDQKDKPKW